MENPSKALPTIEKRVDHLNTIVTAVAVMVFLPLPLLLAFGAKALVPMGAVVFVVAIIRLINSPVQLQRPSVQMLDPISAAARVAQQTQNENAVTGSPSNSPLR